ncbi:MULTISPECIES: N-6 DNA methylase [unclassified Streptomyces]|uniref:N-6 DNA methylase n=1 Tax=unclassified Streptomyces TaxID=2593676 RepID=UPI0022B61F8B|nr:MULTISPECIES: N-6 DNA methylase [unclassified Streptomyces]MCZ7414703.1 N-6 DNA methylase [Streptomyces sp. WMMC897]MCZ7431632.1 N-6 DNA methylase [Streptomyces sp. WMMC1477]
MSQSSPDVPEVTAAGIARLAGVGRAAVSNWRRRYPHFPQPVGGTETSPAFALAEVEEWLRAHGKLAEVPLREKVWQHLEAAPEGVAGALARAGEYLLRRTGGTAPASAPASALAPDSAHAPAPAHAAEAVPGLPALADELGPGEAFAFLLGRYFDANPRAYTLTPPPAADLMARLAGPAATVLDPACGSAELLAAALRQGTGAVELYGQESDPALARLAALRLTLCDGTPRPVAVHVRTEDALRTPLGEQPGTEAVLCHPPFNERNWGHDELAYDPRWAYGLPARTESELAWVQHALARLRPGGTAVLLMPPAAASRRTGRRIRAALLRRGALRAVVALPAGAAPPHSLPLHLWVLRAPGGPVSPDPHLLLLDTSTRHQGSGRDPLPWEELSATVLAAWRAFDAGSPVPEEPGVCGTRPVIDLLDDDVDLAPARHLPPAGGTADVEALTGMRGRLDRTLRRTLELAPAAGPVTDDGPRWTLTTVGELVRGGALELRAGGSGGSGGSEGEPAVTREGDVVIPVQGRGAAYVVAADRAGETLAKPLYLLRPDPNALDPWFVAGFLRSTANTRQASSYASTASRLDVRRLQLPRLPLEAQRRYGLHFRRLADFEAALVLAADVGTQLAQGMFDALTDGTLTPD